MNRNAYQIAGSRSGRFSAIAQQGSFWNYETAQYINGLTTPLSYLQKRKINTLVNYIKKGLGISRLEEAFDIMYILAGETEESSLRNLVKRAHDAESVNSPVFKKLVGFQGDGASSYIKTNYTPDVDGINYIQNNASGGVYLLTSKGVDGADYGAITLGELRALQSTHRTVDDVSYIVVNEENSSRNDVDVYNATGLFVQTRSGESITTLYKNDSIILNGNKISYEVPTEELFILCRNKWGLPDYYSDRRVAFMFLGKSLSLSDVQVVHEAIDSYLSYSLFNSPNSLISPKFYGHRGFTPVAPENSFPAFIACGKRDMWGIETDLWVTSDGVIVCHHDPTIDRMTDGTGTISLMTYAQIQTATIDTGNNVGSYTPAELKIPTLQEYLDICKEYKAVPFIQTKTTAKLKDVVDTIVSNGLEEFAVISSSNYNHLVTVRQYNSRIFVHLIASTIDNLDAVAALGKSGIGLDFATMTQEVADQVHNKGVGLLLGAADTVQDATDRIGFGTYAMGTNSIYEL